MVTLLFLSIIILFLIGAPIAFALGSGALFAMLVGSDLPLMLIPQRMFFGLDSWLLMAIPLFMLAGHLMTSGGMSRRVVEFTTELLGVVRGSLGFISVTASMIFAGVSGSSAADTAAVGSIMLPIMKERGYNMKFATALQAAAGAIGPVIPPSLLMILIGYMTDTSVTQLFLGGVVPGVLIGIGLMVVVYLHARRGGSAYLQTIERVSAKRVLTTGIAALPGLGLPFIIVFGIVFGIFTTTEAAVVAVVYGFVVGMFVYKEITVKDIPKILLESAELATIILFIQATAFLFGWLITVNDVPAQLAESLLGFVSSKYSFFAMYILMLLLIGMVMESFSATIIFIPLVFPIARSFGIDPVHFGVVTTVGWAIGYITPPFGATLFVSCSLTNESIREVTPHILPIVIAMLVVLLLITFYPDAVLWLPKFFS